MCICLDMRMCMNVYMYVYIYIYIYVSIYNCTNVNTCIGICVWTRARAHIIMVTWLYASIYTRVGGVRNCIHLCVCVCVRTRVVSHVFVIELWLLNSKTGDIKLHSCSTVD